MIPPCHDVLCENRGSDHDGVNSQGLPIVPVSAQVEPFPQLMTLKPFNGVEVKL